MKKIYALACTLLLSLGLMTSPAMAKSQCKGLSKTMCATKSDCGWTKGYTRKDGKKVDGYCRVSKAGVKKKATDAKSKAMGKKDGYNNKANDKKASLKGKSSDAKSKAADKKAAAKSKAADKKASAKQKSSNAKSKAADKKAAAKKKSADKKAAAKKKADSKKLSAKDKAKAKKDSLKK